MRPARPAFIESWCVMPPRGAHYHTEMTESAPILNLASLLRSGRGAPSEASASGELPELRYDQGGEETALTFARPAPFDLHVHPIGDEELWLSGRFRPTLTLECSRCLRPVEAPLDLKVGVMLHYRPSTQKPHLDEGEGGEELLVFGEPQLDLSEYLAEATIVATPLSILHDPDCKGLCQVCGTDLNDETCEHQARVPVEAEHPHEIHAEGDASPFAALRGLNLPDE